MKYLLLFILLPVYLAGAVQCLVQPLARPRWRAYFTQQGIAWDQLINASVPPFLTLSYADETMSARLWRGKRRGRLIGAALMPVVDRVFSLWQGADAEIDLKHGHGRSITSHCERAYFKEIERRNMPPEYRELPPVDGAAPIVVFRYGGSDAILGTPAADFELDLIALVRQAKGRRVLLVGLIHSINYEARALEIDARIRAVAQAEGLQFVDTMALPFDAAADIIDGTHPTQAYSDRQARLIQEALGA